MAKFAIYSPLVGWLVDTCAGGAFEWDVEKALWFDSTEDVEVQMAAAEITLVEHLVIRVK